MNKKRAADTVILLIFAAILLIAGIYREQIKNSFQIMCVSCGGTVLFFLLALWDRENPGVGRVQKADNSALKEAVLLSEEDTELMVWDMYGRTAMVIGREGKENQVDIDLRKSPYAGMVEEEHAVLNFSAGQWFVEDIGSGGGVSIKKSDGKVYRLAGGSPCKIERRDCLYVGQNRLLFR